MKRTRFYPEWCPSGDRSHPSGALNRSSESRIRSSGALNRPSGSQIHLFGSLKRPSGARIRPSGALNRPSESQICPFLVWDTFIDVIINAIFGDL